VDKNGDAGLERIKSLEEQLAKAPANSARHRQLARAIRTEAALYRKSLDTAQTMERFGQGSERPIRGHVSRPGAPEKA
jgi:hypothetical protein